MVGGSRDTHSESQSWQESHTARGSNTDFVRARGARQTVLQTQAWWMVQDLNAPFVAIEFKTKQPGGQTESHCVEMSVPQFQVNQPGQLTRVVVPSFMKVD